MKKKILVGLLVFAIVVGIAFSAEKAVCTRCGKKFENVNSNGLCSNCQAKQDKQEQEDHDKMCKTIGEDAKKGNENAQKYWWDKECYK